MEYILRGKIFFWNMQPKKQDIQEDESHQKADLSEFVKG